MKIIKATLIFAIAFHLASCANIKREYPKEWSPLKLSSLGEQCPDISGIYLESGEPAYECPGWHKKCRSLSFNLLSNNIGYMEIWDKSSKPSFLHGSLVEIKQEKNDQIEIFLRGKHGKDKSFVRREMLTLQRGDYTCKDGSIYLKPRAIYLLLYISNVVGTETREILTSEHGELIIHIKQNYAGHHTFVPAIVSKDTWVRFRRVKQEDE
jgi:hypothetical protein